MSMRTRPRKATVGATAADRAHDPILFSTAAEVARFWIHGAKAAKALSPQDQLRTIVSRVMRTPGASLFDVVEKGVPASMVELIASATGQSAKDVMSLLGVSASTYRRKTQPGANEPLPDVAGHRVMAFLRVMATLRRLLEESGDPKDIEGFDVESWVTRWMREPLPELGGKTPFEMLRNPEGQRAVEQLLERMRGGLVA